MLICRKTRRMTYSEQNIEIYIIHNAAIYNMIPQYTSLSLLHHREDNTYIVSHVYIHYARRTMHNVQHDVQCCL